MIKSTAGYHVAIIDPERETDPLVDTGEYRYSPFALLSPTALNAVTERAGGGDATSQVDTGEVDILENGTPPGDGTGYPVGEFPTQADADEYLADNGDGERITFPRSTLSVTVAGSALGVIVNGTECYGVWYNKTRDVPGVFGAAGSHSILNSGGTGDWSLNGGSFAGSPTMQPGDEIEYFLASTTDLAAASIAAQSDLNDTSLQPSNLTRFSVDTGNGYYWKYSNTFIAANSDFTNENADPTDSGDGGNAFKALKPKAATLNFTFNITVQNPDTSVPGLGLELQVTNVTKGLTEPASFQLLDVNGQATIVFSDGSNFVADDGDVISFAIQEYLGGPSVAFTNPAIVLSTADIIAGSKAVTISLTANFELNVEDVKVGGAIYLAVVDGGTAVGTNQVDVGISLVNTPASIGPVEVTVEGTAFDLLAGGYTYAGINIPYNEDTAVAVIITRYGTVTPAINFTPVNNPGDVDPTVEEILFDDSGLTDAERLARFIALVSRPGGILTVTASYDLALPAAALDYDGLQIQDSIVNDTDDFAIFGDIVNGGLAVIDDGALSVEIKIVGESFDVTSPLNNDDVDDNLEYAETVGVTASGWARNVQEGDVISIKIFDSISLAIIPIASASVGAVQLDGTLRITVTGAMITAKTVFPPSQDNNIVLDVEYGSTVTAKQIRYHGFIYQPSGFPDNIPGRAKISIINVTKGTSASAVALIDDNGEYDITVGDGTTSVVASAGDVLHFTIFQDLAPNAVIYPQNPPENPFVGAHDPGEDELLAVQASTFSDASIVDPMDATNIVVEVVLQSAQVTSEEVDQSFVLQDIYTPLISDEIEVQSLPIEVGTAVPLRILPYIEVELPENTSGGVPFELQMWVSNNANDTVPRFDEITTFPPLDTPGLLNASNSVTPLRLHIFSDTTKTAATYAVALKVRMKRNDSTGPFRLHAYGCRYWTRA